MEVHAHTHAARKKWTHYFWEFFMLFLAVTLGFFVENQREHLIEHKREKQYIVSLTSDLQSDTTRLAQGNIWFDNIYRCCDTLLNNYDSLVKGYSHSTIRCFTYVLRGYPDFVNADRTMQQLKNAGGLRLIRKTIVADSIMAYDANIRDQVIEESGITFFYDRLHDYVNEFFNFRKLDKELESGKTPGELEKEKPGFWLTNDPQKIEHFYNLLRKYKTSVFSYRRYLERLKSKASRLTVLLKKEYYFK